MAVTTGKKIVEIALTSRAEAAPIIPGVCLLSDDQKALSGQAAFDAAREKARRVGCLGVNIQQRGNTTFVLIFTKEDHPLLVRGAEEGFKSAFCNLVLKEFHPESGKREKIVIKPSEGYKTRD